MKFSSKILEILTYLDFFQQDISLKLNGSYRISLLSGKFLSIGIIIFLLYNVLESDMIKKINPIIFQQNFADSELPEIILTNGNFSFSFALENDYGFLEPDPKIANFKVYYTIAEYGKEGFKYNSIELETESCQIQHFKQNPQTFVKFNLNKTICVKMGSIRLNGNWNVEKTSYLSLNLEKCDNSTYNDNCKSDEEISKYFNTPEKPKYVNVFYQENNFDLSNLNEPITSKIKSLYSGMEYGQQKYVSLFLKKTSIFSDSQAIFPKDDVINSYSFDRIEYDSYISNKNFFAFQIYVSDIKTVFKRKYEKLFELVAVLGGITKSFSLLFSVLLRIKHDWNINELVINKLFAFRNQNPIHISNNESHPIFTEPKESFRIANDTKRSFIIATDPNKPTLLRNYPRLRGRNRKKNDTQDIIGIGENNSAQNLKMTFWEKVFMFMKKSNNRTEKENLYLDYFRKSNIKLDLITILKKLEEIDRLKLILLSSEQIKFFNSISKQYIFMGNDLKKEENKFEFDSRGFMHEIKKERMKLFEKIKNNFQKNDIDKRLIDLIYEQ